MEQYIGFMVIELSRDTLIPILSCEDISWLARYINNAHIYKTVEEAYIEAYIEAFKLQRDKPYNLIYENIDDLKIALKSKSVINIFETEDPDADGIFVIGLKYTIPTIDSPTRVPEIKGIDLRDSSRY